MSPSSETAAQDTAGPEPRTFTDSRGVSWQVFQVRLNRSPKLASTADVTDGWLTFCRDGEKRRLVPVPSDWATATPEALEIMRDLALPVQRVSPRALRARTSAQRDVFDRRSVPRSPGASNASGDTQPDVVISSDLRERIRAEAIWARESGCSAVQGTVNVRRLLAKVGATPESPEYRASQRLFLDVYHHTLDTGEDESSGAPTV